MKQIFFISILIVFCSCSGEKLDKQALIDKYYSLKFQELQEEREALCKERILGLAQTEIDSLIDTWVNAELIDTILFPPKPLKPGKPDHILDKFQKFRVDSILGSDSLYRN